MTLFSTLQKHGDKFDDNKQGEPDDFKGRVVGKDFR
jgi:hypothetical protein